MAPFFETRKRNSKKITQPNGEFDKINLYLSEEKLFFHLVCGRGCGVRRGVGSTVRCDIAGVCSRPRPYAIRIYWGDLRPKSIKDLWHRRFGGKKMRAAAGLSAE